MKAGIIGCETLKETPNVVSSTGNGWRSTTVKITNRNNHCSFHQIKIILYRGKRTISSLTKEAKSPWPKVWFFTRKWHIYINKKQKTTTNKKKEKDVYIYKWIRLPVLVYINISPKTTKKVEKKKKKKKKTYVHIYISMGKKKRVRKEKIHHLRNVHH